MDAVLDEQVNAEMITVLESIYAELMASSAASEGALKRVPLWARAAALFSP